MTSGVGLPQRGESLIRYCQRGGKPASFRVPDLSNMQQRFHRSSGYAPNSGDKRSAPVTVRFWGWIQFTTSFEAAIMAKFVHVGLTAAAAFILATCGGNVLANN